MSRKTGNRDREREDEAERSERGNKVSSNEKSHN